MKAAPRQPFFIPLRYVHQPFAIPGRGCLPAKRRLFAHQTAGGREKHRAPLHLAGAPAYLGQPAPLLFATVSIPKPDR